MRVFSFQDGGLANFGDDLNLWLWERILPGSWNADSEILFCGIGTVLSRTLLPPAKQYVVFSSGVGYEPPPSHFGSDAWNILCVRGPLTARVLGLPESKAVADGALLLRRLAEFAPLSVGERKGVVFMPHYEALHAGDWRRVAALAGIEFLDPHAPSHETISRIRSSRLVLADAMHAAIVADSLRVPWIPLRTSRQINTFKWLDWSLSMNVPYRPISLPPSTLVESMRNATLAIYGHNFALKESTADAAVKHYQDLLSLKSNNWWKGYSRWARRFTYVGPKKVLQLPGIRSLQARRNQRLSERAAEALQAAAKATPYLSDDSIVERRLDQLSGYLDQIPTP